MDYTIIVLIPAMILAFYAQAKVGNAYRRYSSIPNRNAMTGAEAARRILDSNGLSSVPIEVVRGHLTDHYDPRKKVMRLSHEVYNGTSIASVSIAAHESGHAIQHAAGYTPIKVRNTIAPIVSIASNLAWPLLLLGLFTQYTGLFDIGILLFVSVVVFQAVTLPVEYNASARAIEQLDALGIVYPEERTGAKKVLSAAALTYVAAMAMAVANLLRILLLRNRS